MVKTINQSYQEKYQQVKKRKIFLKVFLFLASFFGLSGAIVYCLFFSGLFEVREINISNGSFIKNQDIRSALDGYLSEKKFIIPKFKSIFLIETEQISALIRREFPAAENIKTKKKLFHALEISLGQKEAMGIWCYQKEKQCLYFDRHGTAFDSVTEASGTILLTVSDERGQFEKLGQPVTDPETLNLIRRANDQLEKMKIEALRFIIPTREDFRLDIQTVEGWKIYLSTKDNLAKQFKSLDIFLAQKVTPEKRNQLQYIDLTVPNRVYYK